MLLYILILLKLEIDEEPQVKFILKKKLDDNEPKKMFRLVINKVLKRKSVNRNVRYITDQAPENKHKFFINKPEKYPNGLKYTLGGILVANTGKVEYFSNF